MRRRKARIDPRYVPAVWSWNNGRWTQVGGFEGGDAQPVSGDLLAPTTQGRPGRYDYIPSRRWPGYSSIWRRG